LLHPILGVAWAVFRLYPSPAIPLFFPFRHPPPNNDMLFFNYAVKFDSVSSFVPYFFLNFSFSSFVFGDYFLPVLFTLIAFPGRFTGVVFYSLPLTVPLFRTSPPLCRQLTHRPLYCSLVSWQRSIFFFLPKLPPCSRVRFPLFPFSSLGFAKGATTAFCVQRCLYFPLPPLKLSLPPVLL